MRFLWESLKALSPESEFNGGMTYESIICVKGVMPSLEEIETKIAELEAAEPLRLLREERDKKLAETDWRATVDYPGNDKQLWLDYRQALRDVTEQDPNNVIWPSEPA